MEHSGSRADRQALQPSSSVGGLRRLFAVALLLSLLLVGGPAFADDDAAARYDSTEAGNPLRIAGYVLHPVGVVLDTVIFRPLAWIGRHEPIKTLVGNTD